MAETHDETGSGKSTSPEDSAGPAEPPDPTRAQGPGTGPEPAARSAGAAEDGSGTDQPGGVDDPAAGTPPPTDTGTDAPSTAGPTGAPPAAVPTGPPRPARTDPPAADRPTADPPAADRPAAAAPAGGVEAGATGPAYPVPSGAGEVTVPIPRPGEEPTVPIPGVPAARSRLTAAGAMIAVLLALLGFTLVVQVKTNSSDSALATTRQEDLVRILSDLEAQEERARQEIAALEDSQRQLNSGAEGRQAALEEATRRADELGILAGTLPASGPGLTVSFSPATKPIAASRVLDAVQELRGAGAEAMQITGGDGATVRIIASTYFLDADGGISVGGRRLTGPYMITVIGDAKTMRTALNIPGGVVASVTGDGGTVTVQERDSVDVTTLSPPKDLQYARPVS